VALESRCSKSARNSQRHHRQTIIQRAELFSWQAIEFIGETETLKTKHLFLHEVCRSNWNSYYSKMVNIQYYTGSRVIQQTCASLVFFLRKEMALSQKQKRLQNKATEAKAHQDYKSSPGQKKKSSNNDKLKHQCASHMFLYL
jgi:hypothetical protein